ncbi:MAG: hypothetical protein IKA18_03370 [Clostridia bacterium]|nr:hypothetical protein [Clostridia bacterium]
MKKSIKVLAIVVALIMLFSLVACEKYPAVSAAFEKAGYTQRTNSISAAVVNSALEAYYKDKGEDEVKAKVYSWSKGGLLTSDQGFVIEFTNAKEMKEFYEQSSNTLKGLVQDITDAGLMNGNCLLLTTSEAMIEVFKKA